MNPVTTAAHRPARIRAVLDPAFHEPQEMTMSMYACHDCDATFNAPTDTDSCRCPGCGERAWKEASGPAAAPSAPADRDLRDRIAQALAGYDLAYFSPQRQHDLADAVLAVLPAPANQTARQLAEVWTVWQEDGPAHGYFTDEVTAKLAAIEEHQASETPGLEFIYAWNEYGGRLELLADGEDTGLRMSRNTVHGKNVPAPADRAAVLLEARDAAWHESKRLGIEMSGDAAYGARAAAKVISHLANEAQQAEAEPQPVAYKDPNTGALYCTRCGFHDIHCPPVTSDDLPDGGICDDCGVDVLIPQAGEVGRG